VNEKKDAEAVVREIRHMAFGVPRVTAERKPLAGG
jgi:hypothetical protein